MGISVVDEPILGKAGAGSVVDGADSLGTLDHARALASFIRDCDTPLTIGVQGEWGSGKTSLLNMIREDIDQVEVSYGQGKPRRAGQYAFKNIWINTWEHSLLKTPEECLISILGELIDSISEVDGSWKNAQKAKSALGGVVKGALKVGATAALGKAAGEVAGDLIDPGSSNSVKVLRQTLVDTIEEIVERDQQDYRKFVIYIDDLDRLLPSTAVMVLELLKNIFSLPHCVFVLAIDYQVVVKGLVDKFGPLTEENEWEFRAFFDKIIQLPFMMPMATYDLDRYVSSLLASTSFFTARELKPLQKGSHLANLVRFTVGSNPRSLKRLANSLSLINLYHSAQSAGGGGSSDESRKYILKQLLFAFVCIQISFPKIYEVLVHDPQFEFWDDGTVRAFTRGLNEEDNELHSSLGRAIEVNEQDFDEEWEKVLFKIVWLNKWQRNRLIEASRALSVIKDDILQQLADERAREELVVQALRLTAVTAVSSTDEGIFSRSGDAEGDEAGDRDRIIFWQQLTGAMKGSATTLDTSIKPTFSLPYLRRVDPRNLPEVISYVVNTNSSRFLTIEIRGGDEAESKGILSHVKARTADIERLSEQPMKIKSRRNSLKRAIYISLPESVPQDIDLAAQENQGQRDFALGWLRDALPQLEQIVREAYSAYEADEANADADPADLEG